MKYSSVKHHCKKNNICYNKECLICDRLKCDCFTRKVQCEYYRYCKWTGLLLLYPEHHKVCGNFPIQCKKCEWKSNIKLYNDHLINSHKTNWTYLVNQQRELCYYCTIDSTMGLMLYHAAYCSRCKN
jgi:hypothetical protein